MLSSKQQLRILGSVRGLAIKFIQNQHIVSSKNSLVGAIVVVVVAATKQTRR
jgi:hypothetical protein